MHTNKPRLPGEELINSLEAIRKSLSGLKARIDDSGVERTHGLKTAMGNECKWYRKSLSLFLDNDYEEVRDLVNACAEIFERIER